MKINIHSVYLAREHIIFLEEWLLYHMWTGVNHFYLYDNTGSSGRAYESFNTSKGKDKRGYDIKSITSHLTDNDIHHIQEKIFKKYPGLVAYVKWQPRHPKFSKIITMEQTEAIKDYVSQYSSTADWTYFIDMDEFFYSPMKKTLRECVLEQEEAGISKLVIRGNSFLSRYKLDENGDSIVRNKYQSQIFGNLGYDIGAPKQVIRCKDLLGPDKWVNKKTGKLLPAMHYTLLKPGCKVSRGWARKGGTEYARFNHYNMPDEMIDWPPDRPEGVGFGVWGKHRRPHIEKKFPNGMEDIYYDNGLAYMKPKLDNINMVINEYIDIF